MSRLDEMFHPFDLHDRAVINFKVKVEKIPDGRCHTTVRTLHDTVVLTIESADEAEAERHLRDAGYKRVPPYVAHEIDILR